MSYVSEISFSSYFIEEIKKLNDKKLNDIIQSIYVFHKYALAKCNYIF